MRTNRSPRRPRLVTLALSTLLLLLLSAPALADGPEKKKKKVVIDFTDLSEEELKEDFAVPGYVHEPEVGYVLSRIEAEDKEIAELKDDLTKELLKSVKEIEK